MELEKASAIAEELKGLLEPGCQRIEIAGSIRRLKLFPNDIEFLCVPRFVDGVDQLDREIGALVVQRILGLRRNKLGRSAYGPKNKLMLHIPSGMGVDIFSTTDECWAVSLVVRTGGEKTNKRIATTAIRKGWRWRAYGDGFDTPDGHIICSTEREVFEAVDLPYLEPEKRE